MSDQKLGGNIGMPPIRPGMIKIPGGSGAPPEAPDSEEISAEETEKIIARAKKNFELSESEGSDNRDAGRDDDNFFAGNQWNSTDSQKRIDLRQPVLTFNQMPTFCNQIINDYRMNRMGITVLPMDEGADEQAAKYQAAWIRAVERRCHASLAYDTGMGSGVRKGYGYWRILLEYEDDNSFHQVPVARRIVNAESVHPDPAAAAESWDLSTARWCHIAEMIPRDTYKQDYPNANEMGWPISSAPSPFGSWADKMSIRVSEYFEITREKRRLVKLNNGFVGFWESIKEHHKESEIVDERQSWEKTMTWYKMTGVEILEWATWPIDMIPIVRTIGDEIYVNGKTLVWGVVRQAKDPQRAYNYYRSKEAENLALASMAPWVAAEGQTENYEQDFKSANDKPIAVLKYNPVSFEGHLVPPPHREPPPPPPTGFMQGAANAMQDMVNTTGVRFPASGTQNEHVYDESGRALREMRRSGDIGTFHYIDNFAQALRRTGDIYLALMKAIMVEPRFDTVTHEDGKDELVRFDPHAPKPVQDGKHPVTGKTIKIVNPLLGRYGTTVAIGPDYATRRVEAAESMADFMRVIGPEKAGLIAHIVAETEDWPGHEKIAKTLASVLPPGVVQPEMKDVPPQVQALLTQQQQQLMQAQRQIQAMMKQLNDRQQDFALRADKQEKDFEAKILQVMQKEIAANQTHLGSQLKDLADAVKSFEKIMSAPTGAANGAI